MQLLDGKLVREARLPLLLQKIKELSFVPTLVIIQVGNREDSTAFIKAKKSFAQKIGIKEIHLAFPENISQSELISEIKKQSEDTNVHGIIVQLPLPPHIDPLEVIEAIDPKKDVDGLTSFNTKHLLSGHEKAIMPATTRGIKELLDYYKIDLFNKKVAMVGRSNLVGKPTALMCLNQNATVTICHSKTENLAKETREADILIVAIGQPLFIGKECVHTNQIVIDVGINRLENGTLAGDVNFEEVKDIVKMITPVPGGVGQMTVLALFENLIDACYNPNISRK